MAEINHESVLVQVRQGLGRSDIKLWEEPYCIAGESNDNEIDVSKQNLIPRRIFFFSSLFSRNFANLETRTRHK